MDIEKIFLILLVVIAFVSICIVSANQFNNTHEDNILLKPLEVQNEHLGTWTTHSEIEVEFYTNKNSIYNGDEIEIRRDVDFWPCCMGGDYVHLYIDGNYVEDILLDTNTKYDTWGTIYKFHDLTSGEHTFTLIYDGYKHGPLLPDIEPCSYTTKINVISDYKINVDRDVSVYAGEPVVINGTFVNKGNPVKYGSIEVYINNKFDSVVQSDSQGHFKYSFTSDKKGDYDVNFRFMAPNWDATNSSSHVKVIRDDNLTMDLNPRNMTVKSGETGIFNGTLYNKGKPMANVSIDVYINNRFIKVIKTDSEGHFSYPFTSDSPGGYYVTFLHGTSEYGPITETSFVNVYD